MMIKPPISILNYKEKVNFDKYEPAIFKTEEIKDSGKAIHGKP